ncbi:MAG TPA: PKD domain-containing protein [Solirubrobacterales bacterium]|nr:PKD domain-containing protein [Solirubrobacterales bacterium]
MSQHQADSTHSRRRGGASATRRLAERLRAKRPALLALLPLALFATASPASAAPTWLAPQPVSEEGPEALEPQVATDPQGEAIAIWAGSDGANERVEVAFRPAGGAFGVPQKLSPAGQEGSEPQVATDPQGNAIAVWSSADGANERVEAAFRPAGGAFGTPQTLTPACQRAFEPQVATDPQGDAIVVWTCADGAGERVEAALRPAGGFFATPQTISAPEQIAFHPQVATDPQGDAIVVWAGSDGAGERVEAALRPAGGPFEELGTLSGEDASDPQVATDPQGDAIAVWSATDENGEHVEAALRHAGGAFGTPQPPSEAGQDASEPQVATDPQGDAIAVWRRSDGANARIEAALRPAGGAFGVPQKLSGAGQDASNPQVATYPQGDAIAVWRRSDGADERIEAAGLDASGPLLESLAIPASAQAGEPASFSVDPLDVWSTPAETSTSWSFGDGGSAQGTAVSHAFARPGTYQVTVTSTDSVGNATSATGTVTVKEGPPAPVRENSHPTERDTRRPKITGLRVTPRTIAAASRKGRAHRPKARIRFTLNEKTTVVLTAKRRLHRRCGRRRCVKLVAVPGRLTVGGKTGANSLPFAGTLGGRRLRSGRYVLNALATDPSGKRSQPARAKFTVR